MSRVLRQPPPSAEAGTRRILLIGAGDAAAWSAFDADLDIRAAAAVAEAADLLDRSSFDVVIVDAALAAPPADAAVLRERLGHAALLIHADNIAPDSSELMERLGAACILPAQLPEAAQARIIALAAQHASATAALADRVDELEQRTRELERSRSRFRDVIERNADAIIVVDGDGIICFANTMAARLFRSRREDLTGSHFGFPLLVGETTELDLPHPDEIRTVEMRVVESEWEGEPAHIATLRDITQRKRDEDSARRLIREQTARSAAEKAAQRFRFLAEAGTRLSMPLDESRTFATLAELCVGEIADWAAIHEVDEIGAVCRVEVAHRDGAATRAVATLPGRGDTGDSAHAVMDVLRTRTPALIADVADDVLAALVPDETARAAIRDVGVSSVMLVPLVARERDLGVIVLGSAGSGHRFSDEDLAVAAALAHRAALAVDNARLYREASEANRAKTDLLAVISHDLRTPLNAIMGHVDLLSLGIPDRLSDGALARVERIRMSASHLVYLIDELLAFARLDGGREELRLQDIDAAIVVRDVASVIEPLALERGLGFDIDLPDDAVSIRTDPDRLRQVLLNLVGNAVKYTADGEVRLGLEYGNSQVCFAVRDTGPGIPEEHLERIFEPFWQLDPEQRSRNGGTGLGLSVVRRLVGLLGGRVVVQSEPGRGSTFTVRLPEQHTAAASSSALTEP